MGKHKDKNAKLKEKFELITKCCNHLLEAVAAEKSRQATTALAPRKRINKKPHSPAQVANNLRFSKISKLASAMKKKAEANGEVVVWGNVMALASQELRAQNKVPEQTFPEEPEAKQEEMTDIQLE